MNLKNKRAHLINLYKWRSLVAYIACLVTIVLSIGSVVYGILTEVSIESVQTEFEWFTVDSNFLNAFATLMILPYTIEGIKKKRLTYPKWQLLVHYAGTICTTLTFVFVLFFVSWFDPQLAFGDENIFLHIVCPIAVLISFFMVETERELTKKDTIIGLIPFFIYVVAYLYNVVIAHNWEDHYQLNTLAPFYVSLPLMIILAYSIAIIIRVVHNKILRIREKKLRLIWDEDLDPVTIKIEVYSLGMHTGLHQDKQDITVPFDLLEDIANRFNIKIDELCRAYTKGVIDGFKEREKQT